MAPRHEPCRRGELGDGRDWVELAVADTGIGLTLRTAGKTVPGIHRHRSLSFPKIRSGTNSRCEENQSIVHSLFAIIYLLGTCILRGSRPVF
jgi:hypothetical protein